MTASQRALNGELVELMDREAGGRPVTDDLLGWVRRSADAGEITATAAERLAAEVAGGVEAHRIPLLGTFGMAAYELGDAGRNLLKALHRTIPDQLERVGAISAARARAMRRADRGE